MIGQKITIVLDVWASLFCFNAYWWLSEVLSAEGHC